MNSIKLKDVSFTYPKGNFNVNVDSLEFEEGKLYLVLGKNGSGKTTMLKLCCGILKPDSGTVEAFDKNISTMNLGEIGEYISYLFQEPSKQLFATTVWDEMTFAAYFKGEDEIEARDRAIMLLKKFNLYHLIKRSTYRLSRGEKQRLAIATILMQNIRFLILDEPTTGLDHANRRILYNVIKSLINEGTGVAIITHDNEVIEEFSDATFVKVEQGKISSVYQNTAKSCDQIAEDTSKEMEGLKNEI